MQIVVYGASLINPLKKEFPLMYRINISEFAKMFGREHKKIYSDIKEIVFNKFWDREFTFTDGQGHRVKARWLTTVKYLDSTGFFEIHFNPEIKALLHQIQKNFTTYYVEQIAKLRSFYSVRMYEIAIMQANKSPTKKGVFKLTVAEIKETFGVTEKYKRFCDLKQRVLEPMKKEINKHSNIKLAYEIIKKGRTPYEVRFTATHREKKEEQLPLIETPEINLSPEIIEKAKKIIQVENRRLDVYDIAEQFKSYAQKNGTPKNVNGAFIGFVKKKTAKTE